MKKKGFLSILLATAMLGSMVAAVPAAAADEDQTLTVWCWDPNFNIYAMQQAEKIYQEDHPDFKLDIQENVYSDIETKLITAATSGDYSTLPDIFLMQDYSYHKDVTSFPDVFTELTESGIDFTQFSAGKLADSTVDGKNYGVPFDNGATIMAIRSDIVEEAGLTTDDFKDITWSKFMELAYDFIKSTFGGSVELYDDLLVNAGAIASYLPAAESDVYQEASDFYGGQKVYADIVDFASKVPAFDCGAYYSDVRSALTDVITNVVQNGADVADELQTAQDTVEFNIEG